MKEIEEAVKAGLEHWEKSRVWYNKRGLLPYDWFDYGEIRFKGQKNSNSD